MKVLLLNGSPHEKGSTYTALRAVADGIEESGIETEIYHISPEPVRGCMACFGCMDGKNRCIHDDDEVNIILEKLETADGLVLGSPVYYASPNGHVLSVMDRVSFASTCLKGKPGAAVCSARRAGTTATLDALNKYFQIAGMPIAASTYWPMIHGQSAEQAEQDLEGLQAMRVLGRNLAWLIRSIEAGKAAGIQPPETEEKVWTNFIR
ncbi:MAG: flavodoxin family protein [Clostridiales bacterium]|nr:flavodoxin family protein [Clostridiales bacterium]